ncbi:MAG: SLBB domain-containing protein [Candidatus Latescibacter sp.]|nr:SLBB domain-containing protein [Candidatus Latescibacter sp.]
MAVAGVDSIAAVLDAGVVGAGGAGFPTHVKLGNEVDTYIANGAECEPIVESDLHLMITHAPEIIRGFEAAMEQVGASRGFIAIKDKNVEAITAVERAISGKPRLSVEKQANTYPAGDEMVLTRQITGRIVPPGGLPFQVGVTVSNVTTLKQVSDALDGKPVISRLVTVGGEVSRHITVDAPLGTPIRDLVDLAGGASVREFVIIYGGPIMGPIGSIDDYTTKTMGGIIILPADHTVVRLKQQTVPVTKLRAKWCCTCQECTILCPRNALGHPINPAKMMSKAWHIDEILRRIESRELDSITEQMVFEALLCCQCGICEQYACIFGLSPNKVYALVRDAIRKSGLKFDFSKIRLYGGPMFDFRKIPALTYARKLDLERYLVHTDLLPAGSLQPKMVKIALCQHLGAPAKPVVKTGDRVKEGDLIGEIPQGALSARVHASINGRVEEVTDTHIVIGGLRS